MLPKVGEQELRKKDGFGGLGGKKWKHSRVVEAKPLDKLHKDYERKARQLKKKKVEEVGTVEGNVRGPDRTLSDKRTKKLGRRQGGKSIGRLKNELKTVEQIHKSRKMTEKKRAKNARPSRKGKR